MKDTIEFSKGSSFSQGEYIIQSSIRKGMSADLYLGTHNPDRQRVAIKILRPFVKPDERELFLQEIDILSRLQHAHIIPKLNSGEENGRPFFVMPYAEHGNLQTKINAKPLTEQEILEFSRQLIGALQHTHDNEIIHNDIKGGNILLPNEGHSWITDYGIATDLRNPISHRFRTVHAMAPEFIFGNPDQRSDQYSFGLLLAEMVLQRRLFDYEHISDKDKKFQAYANAHFNIDPAPLFPVISPFTEALKPVILKTLEKRPEHRYGKIIDVYDALTQAYKDALEQGKIRKGTIFLPPTVGEPSLPGDETERGGEPSIDHKAPTEEDSKNTKVIVLFSPNRSESYRWLGETRLALAKYKEASTAFDEAIKLNPDNAYAYYGKGITLSTIGENDEAIGAFDKAIDLAIEQDIVDARFPLGKANALFRLGKFADAIEAYDDAALCSANDGNAYFIYYNKALAAEKLGNNDYALENYKRALAMAPNDSEACAAVGNVLIKLGRYEDALYSFDQAIHLNPNNSTYYHNKAVAYYNLGEFSKAITTSKKALQINPFNAETYRNLSIFHLRIARNNLSQNTKDDKTVSLQETDFQYAADAAEESIRLNPENADSYHYLAQSLTKLGRYEDALGIYEKIIAQNPRERTAHINKAVMLTRVHRYQEALRALQQAEDTKNSDIVNGNIWYNRGIALVNLGKYKDAEEAFEKAIEFNEEDSRAHNGLAVTLGKQRKYKQAIVASWDAIHYDKNNSEAYFTLGLAYESTELDRYLDTALEAFEKVLELEPDNPDAHIHKGIILQKKGKGKEKRRQYIQAAADYTDALMEMDTVLLQNPKNAEALYHKAVLLNQLGHYEDALQITEKILQLRGEDRNLLHIKGLIFHNLKRPREAEHTLQKAVKAQPQDEKDFQGAGIQYGRPEEYEESIKLYEAEEDLQSDDSNVYNRKGLALSKNGRYKEAITAYQKALALNPKNSAVYYNMSLALGSIRRYKKALGACETAILLDRAQREHTGVNEPQHHYAFFGKGLALAAMGQHQQAIDAYKQALQFNNRAGNVHYALSQSYAALGMQNESYHSYQEAIKLNKDLMSETDVKRHSNIFLRRGIQYIAEKRYTLAKKELDTALELDNKNPLLFYWKAVALANEAKKLNDYGKVLSQYKEVRDICLHIYNVLQFRHVDVINLLGEAYHTIGVEVEKEIVDNNQEAIRRYDEVIDHYKQSKQKNKNLYPLLTALLGKAKAVESLMENPDYNLAIQLYEEALTISPHDREILKAIREVKKKQKAEIIRQRRNIPSQQAGAQQYLPTFLQNIFNYK